MADDKTTELLREIDGLLSSNQLINTLELIGGLIEDALRIVESNRSVVTMVADTHQIALWDGE